ncbi:hypothetical protein GCK72_007217 [Caenorhabditis remanei]|uniref:Glycosyltransferase family 92 protein n=1 Tax=Caenorhabditis remanei TaxID=31234 RepID=A0A6A5HHE7_CAERE|nr:hypothetical protein GCK72_007217 [Caenorhabditis remanei]KAF1767258.1 hypothetical protein GCK72_007217 [Caenorhabditis remanei]
MSRTTPPRLRILALAGCVRETDYLLVDVFYEGVKNPKRLRMFGDAHEANCPDIRTPGTPCFYVPNTFISNLTVAGRSLGPALDKYGKLLEDNQIFGYTDRHFQGIIELRSWPSFGSLPPEIEIASKFPKFDESSYILSQFLALNLCVLEMKTTIGTVADLDEIIVPKNGRLLEYSMREMVGTNVGALSIENHYVGFKPSIYSNNFNGVATPIFYEKEGRRKYVFNTSTIDICQVHFARSFIDPSKIEKNASEGSAALLHFRVNVDEFHAKIVKEPYHFFPGNHTEHIQNMQDTAINIFGNHPLPEVIFELIDVMNRCVERIERKGECRSTGSMCKEEMDAVYNWVYDKTEGLFLSGEFEK